MSVLPITQRVRDNIIRVLSDAYPHALQTAEILIWLQSRHGCNHTFRRTFGDPEHTPDYLPHQCQAIPQHPCYARCWYNQTYPNLRALCRQGSVQWHPGEASTYGTSWCYEPNPEGEPIIDPARHDTTAYASEIVDLDVLQNLKPHDGRPAPP